jgi:hypothetical protein
MKSITQFINEAEFCKADDICYVVVDVKTGDRKCTYLPYTGFGEGEELKKVALKMADFIGNCDVKEVKYKDLQK